MKKIILIIGLLFLGSCMQTPPDIYGGNLPQRQNVYSDSIPQQGAGGYVANQAQKDESSVFRYDEDTITIALLVPLSGDFKELGQSMVDAAQMALFSINDSKISLMPIDTNNSSLGAVEGARKAREKGASLILGPIFSDSAKAVAQELRGSGINIIAFSNDKTIADSGAFTIGHMPEEEIKRVVEFAINSGIEDFVTVLPNNTYGGIVAKDLRETIESNPKNSLLRTEIYRLDRKGESVKLSTHAKSAYQAAVKNKPAKDYNEKLKMFNDNPIKYPRGMVIPEGGQRLNEISEALYNSGFDGTKVQLIGTSQWTDKDIANNSVLNGAWIVAPQDNRSQEFKADFERIYGYKPNELAPLAYDGMALAATLARSFGSDKFSREKLTSNRGFVGVDGAFRLRSDGLPERSLAIMKINNGQLEVISPAPSGFID